MANIYDGAFRTILNDCRKLIIPIINEVFKESYTGDEKIEFFPNEHFIDQQDEADKERITDTNFRITGRNIKKYHLECERNTDCDIPQYGGSVSSELQKDTRQNEICYRHAGRNGAV